VIRCCKFFIQLIKLTTESGSSSNFRQPSHGSWELNIANCCKQPLPSLGKWSIFQSIGHLKASSLNCGYSETTSICEQLVSLVKFECMSMSSLLCIMALAVTKPMHILKKNRFLQRVDAKRTSAVLKRQLQEPQSDKLRDWAHASNRILIINASSSTNRHNLKFWIRADW
jgi:hypothetical protein